MSSRSRRWLSSGAEQLEARLAARCVQEPFDCDVLVIGSGYGGAVAAARLAGSTFDAEGGRRATRVWLVERGAEVLPGQFPARFSELAGHVRLGGQNGRAARGREEGLFDIRLGPDVAVLLGNGLGGGSLINAGVMARPADETFQTSWPSAITAQSLAPFYERALCALSPTQITPQRQTRKLAMLDKLATAGGLGQAERCAITVNVQDASATSSAGVALESCTLCGDCMTGCNQAAKGSLDTNYLARAWRRGAEFFCGVAVEGIAPGSGGMGWQVHWRYTDRQLRLTQPMAGTIRARHVVLAAGSLGSTEILLRSRPALGLPKAALGKRFSTNGDAIVASTGHRERVGIAADPETDPADGTARMVGPTITGMVRVPQHGDDKPAFVVQEFGVPGALRQVLGEVSTWRGLFGLSEGMLDPVRMLTADPFVVYDDAIERTSLYGVMGDDGARGEMILPAGEPGGSPAAEGSVRIRWSADDRPERLFEAARAWLSDTGKATVLPSSDLLLGAAPMVTVHPLGGCAMAERGSAGVVNDIGLVFRGEGPEVHTTLAVLDGSIVPHALGINPALTIAALAERALPELMKAWGLRSAEVELRPLPEGRRAQRRRELPPAETTWGVRERQQGPCEIDGQHYWARLELEFDPVPGFGKALQLTRRVIKVKRAQLTLRQTDGAKDEFTIDDEPGDNAEGRNHTQVMQLTGSVELFSPEDWPDVLDDHSVAEKPVHLTYRLAVQSAQAGDTGAAATWPVGARLVGVKTLHAVSGPSAARGPWRELSEMEMSLDGRPIGRWALDLADLAQRRDPLLSLLSQSTMPDALADLGAVTLYGLRRVWQRLIGLAGRKADPTDKCQLLQRWPGPYKENGPSPTVYKHATGGRLTHYPGQGTPVVLIHGLGASGSNFTHPAIEHNLVRHLHERTEARDVWVLDLRSSIANDAWRRAPDSAQATVEGVALSDIPGAIEKVCEFAKCTQVDVVAHCMGAIMFSLAALGDTGIAAGRVRAAVLSQTGPLVRMSPLNQLRGFVGSYLQEFLQVEELDATPDVELDEQGVPHNIERSGAGTLLDAALATFPYPDDDKEEGVSADPLLKGTAFRNIRHRADAIFGQLFELDNMAPKVLAHLAALFGWVKVPMLAQAIHFARQEMLTDARGRNAFLSRDRLNARFAFPVLIVHGQRNRMFDWRGGLRSLHLLRRARGGTEVAAPALDTSKPGLWHYAAGERAQLAVLERYGHLDCMLGKKAHEEVFPLIDGFFADADTLKDPQRVPDHPHDREPEPPGVGPMLGALCVGAAVHDAPQPRAERNGRAAPLQFDWIEVTVLIHPSLRRRQTHGLVVFPVRRTVAGPKPDLERAAWLHWPGRRSRRPREEQSMRGPAVTAAGVLLWIDRAQLPELGDTFAVLTVHKDLGFPDATARADVTWLHDAYALFPEVAKQVGLWVDDAVARGQLEGCLFSLPEKVLKAADIGQSAPRTPALCFALASCQYPPGLLDRAPAQASLRRLLGDASAAEGPQFMLLAGDQVYVDATAGVFDAGAASGTSPMHLAARMDRTYELNWGLPAFRRLAARLPIYPMLDDHEVQDNWQGEHSPGGAEQAAALGAYERHQQVLVPDEARLSAASRSYLVHPAGVPLFVLDTRSRRSLRTASNIEQASILAEGDLAALIESLAALPREIVKLVLTPVPMLPPEKVAQEPLPERLRSDSWSGFPASAASLLGAIRERDIRRVVLLSGDSHLSSVSSFRFADVQGKPANAVVSIVSSGSYAPWPFANQRPDELVLSGHVEIGAPGSGVIGSVHLHALSAADGYAIVHLSPGIDAGPVELRVSLRGGDGSTIDSRIDLQ